MMITLTYLQAGYLFFAAVMIGLTIGWIAFAPLKGD